MTDQTLSFSAGERVTETLSDCSWEPGENLRNCYATRRALADLILADLVAQLETGDRLTLPSGAYLEFHAAARA